MKILLQALPATWTPADIAAAGRFFFIMFAVFAAIAVAEWANERRSRRAVRRNGRAWPRFDDLPDAAELRRRQAARRAMERSRE